MYTNVNLWTINYKSGGQNCIETAFDAIEVMLLLTRVNNRWS